MDKGREPMQSKPSAGEKGQVAQKPRVARTGGARRFIWHGLIFVLVGLVLYSGVYAWSERLVYKNTQLNRFFKIKTASAETYDYAIMGASHALVMDLEDMNARLEKITGAKIMNLGEMGGGPAISRVLLDYFLARHETRAVVYFVDSFSFYSQDWNETRLKDVALYQRAPFDPALVNVLLQNPATRWVGLDYLFGFSKNNFWVSERINNSRLFRSDISSFPQAARFKRVDRPVPQVDRLRIDYLYPGKEVDQELFQHYMAEFEDQLRLLKDKGIRVILIRPPLPERIYKMVPNEAWFDGVLKDVAQRHGAELYDFAHSVPDEKLYMDADHLNEAGMMFFSENFLKKVLTVPVS